MIFVGKRRSDYQSRLGILLLPYLLGTGLLILIPALVTGVIAFTHYDSLSTPSWAGLDNFRELLRSPLVRLSLRNSLIFLLTAVPLRLAAALMLALLLERRGRLYGLCRAAVYLPTVMPEAAYALVWLWILNPVYGPLNHLLTAIGLPAPAWLAEPESAVAAMVLMSVFQFGEGFVVLLAGLKTIPRHYYESALVDGGTAWQVFWRITLPLITPWLLLLSFRDLIVSLQNTFTPSFIMTYGGPYYATTFAPLLIYEIAFDIFDFGLAAALLVLLYLLIGLLIIGFLNLSGTLRGANAA